MAHPSGDETVRRERREAALMAALEIGRLAQNATVDEIVQFTIEEGVRLTGSKIGFFHFAGPGEAQVRFHSWSQETRKHCAAQEMGRDGPMSETGVLADCLRLRRPVTHNDYPDPPDGEGRARNHAHHVRELAVPVIEQDKVMAILGVGNRGTDYDGADVEQLTLLAENAWVNARRRRTEEELRTRDAELTGLFRVAPVGFGVVVDRVFTELNDVVCQMLGYRREELIGQKSRLIYPDEEEYERVGTLKYGQIRKHGRGTIETRFRRKDGQCIDVILSSTPLDADDWSKGVTFTALDITERKQTEERLRESELRYRGLFERISSGAAVYQAVDDGGDFVFVDFNRASERIERVSKEDVVGKRITEVFPGVAEFGLLDVLRRVWRTGEPAYHPVALYKDNRAEGWRENFLYRLPSGEVVAVYDDVTEQKEAEQREAALEEQLRQAQKMEALGTLAGGIAHDFNNILGAIIGFTEIALGQIRAGGAPAAECLEEVLNAAERARSLVKQILAFSRRDKPEKTPISLAPLVKEALKLIRGAIPATVEIRQNIVTCSDTLLADATQIHQVVMNLCTNAWHAMAETGGELSVSLIPVTLDPESAQRYASLQPGPYWGLEVSDTGCGIEEANLSRIFDPFFTTKDRGRGTGMGLAVVHGIVTGHGGAITAESTVGKGSVFRVLLPRTELPAGGSPPPPKAPAGRGEKILLVEDEEPLRDLQSRWLRALGYTVEAYPDGATAWEAFSAGAESCDLVLTDLTMPRMAGLELAKKIRTVRKDVPIILCTGFSENATPGELREREIQQVLHKPLRRHELASAVRKALDGKGR